MNKPVPWHGSIAGIAPPAEAIAARKKPKHWASWDDWSLWWCFRGAMCGAHGDSVLVGLSLSAQPLDGSIGFRTEFVTLDLDGARELRQRLDQAIALAENAAG